MGLRSSSLKTTYYRLYQLIIGCEERCSYGTESNKFYCYDVAKKVPVLRK